MFIRHGLPYIHPCSRGYAAKLAAAAAHAELPTAQIGVRVQVGSFYRCRAIDESETKITTVQRGNEETFPTLYQTSEFLTLERKGFPGKRRRDSVPPWQLIRGRSWGQR